MACLDTSFLVDLSRKNAERRRRAHAKYAELLTRPESLATTRFNVAELYVGVNAVKDAQAEEKRVQALLSGLEILEFDANAARLFGAITAYLRRRGAPAGDMDVLIAATALSAGHSVVTGNPDHFAGIPDLRVETY